MSSAKITTVGFYQYMNAYNNDLFGLLNLPPGIDKDTLINNILLRGGEFEVIYSNPDFYKSAIGLWSNKHYRTFEKWINALNIDYNPLENYDRMEEWSDAGSRTNTGTVSDTGSIINTGTQSTNTTGKDTFTDSGNSTSTDEISAYNSASFQNDKKNTTNSSNSSETNTTTNSTRTDNLTESNSNTRTDNLSESNSNTRTDNLSEKTSSNRIGRAHGNIGVTTSQQMLQSELDIAKWNIYEQITDLFLSEFCIMVYV